jgi:putative FmdB family regulatory protein
VATYEYVCLACERTFEERRSPSASVDTLHACPSCGSDRIRRRFSFMTTRATEGFGSPSAGVSSGGCACGGACSCRA